MAGFLQGQNCVRTDIAGAARNQNSHGLNAIPIDKACARVAHTLAAQLC
jgi:hypothetical protein